MGIQVIKNYLTQNDCYKSGRTITPDCMQLHTIGTGQNTASSLASYWNQSGIQACVHYCIDAEKEDLVLQFLPDNYRSWADAGYGNSHAITVELMESDYMKYSGDGASYTITNEAKFKADVTRAYNTAVKFFAMKCRQYGWNPQEKMSNGLHRVFSHDEGRRLGLSSAHVDPTHIWDRYGWTMDKFRSDVVVEMGLTTAPVDETKYFRVRVAWDMPETQLGAFIAKENAIANCPSGYSVFDNDGKLVYENNTTITIYPSGIPKSKEDFIQKVSTIAIELFKETAILPSVMTAQCCLETGFGLSSDCEQLVQNNNLLGMKADLINNTWQQFSVWNGCSFVKTTPEYYNGKLTYIRDEFRVYKDYENCIRDYEQFLLNVQNAYGYKYRKISGMVDPEKVITAISQGGYATDPNYITSVMRMITQYNLTKYDEIARKMINPEAIPEEKPMVHYIVQAGSFLLKMNANRMQMNLASKTIPSIIKKDGLSYKVQVGDYMYKQNAEFMLEKLESQGFKGIIKEVIYQ